jgi:hypothetical protein
MHQISRYIATWLLLFGLGMACLPAQVLPQGRLKGTMGYVTLGPNMMDLGPLNRTLEEENFPVLPERLFALGFGMERVSGPWIVGGELYNFLMGQRNFNNADARLNYHYLNLHLGVIAWRQPNGFVYPTIGGGGGLAQLRTRPADEQLPDSRWTGGALLEGAIRGRWFAPLDEQNQLVIGASVGYLYTFAETWTRSDIAPDEVTSLSPAGFYLRVSLGMSDLR